MEQEIYVGMGATEYLWSDSNAYEVVTVKDQKHITIREYDHKLIGDAYTENWQLISNPSNPDIELAKRGKYWYIVTTATTDDLDRADEIGVLMLQVNGFDPDTIRVKGKQTRYSRINIRFGHATYYYDWSF